MRVLILNSQNGDWEGLFIDEKLIDEGHTLEGGTDNAIYWLEKAEKYGFTMTDVCYLEVNDKDENYLYNHGSFPNTLSELNGAARYRSSPYV